MYLPGSSGTVNPLRTAEAGTSALNIMNPNDATITL
jgi:hypothetical protein